MGPINGSRRSRDLSPVAAISNRGAKAKRVSEHSPRGQPLETVRT